MNLIEHPFGLLKRSDESELYLEWEKVHPRTGKKFTASWHVRTNEKLGLPGPTEERLYLVLMELSREQGWPRKVMFSRNDVLQRLGISKNKAAYQNLNNSFLRLKSVVIEAKKSFWKAENNDFSASLLFNLLDEVEILDETGGQRKDQIPLALSSFTWGGTVHETFVAGNIRSLPLQFVLSLQLPLSTRLFRFLDKHRTGGSEVRHKFEIELCRLCEIHLGMTAAKYSSHAKQRLLPALTELKERGFLAEWNFEPMKSAPGKQKVVFTFTNGVVPEEATETVTADALAANAPQNAVAEPQIDLAFLLEEEAALDRACDAVFAELETATQENINARAHATLPAFLQENLRTPGARHGLEKERRLITWLEHKAAVRALLNAPGAEA